GGTTGAGCRMVRIIRAASGALHLDGAPWAGIDLLEQPGVSVTRRMPPQQAERSRQGGGAGGELLDGARYAFPFGIGQRSAQPSGRVQQGVHVPARRRPRVERMREQAAVLL